MEKKEMIEKRKHLLHLLLIASLIFLAMLLCAMMGYQFVRDDKSEQDGSPFAVQQNHTESVHEEDTPALIAPTDIAPASLPKEDVEFQDTNDYLVIAQDGVVKLYILTKDGGQIYTQDLPIAPDALLDEDRILLEDGIILKTAEELAALLEDYTS